MTACNLESPSEVHAVGRGPVTPLLVRYKRQLCLCTGGAPQVSFQRAPTGTCTWFRAHSLPLPMQMVVAYDPPLNVTLYIQSRGRARAAGSTYAWLRPEVGGRIQMEDKKNSLER